MSFGRINRADCVNVPPPADPRCADPAFALQNPSICPVEPQLIIKPAQALTCALGSVQFKAFYIVNNTETDVTDSTVFQSSDPNIAVVGASSGNATGLSTGSATVSATYLGKTTFAELDVLGDNCCDDRTVAMMLVVDRSKSMSQLFNSSYSTKLIYAKAAATRFISEVNELKDLVGLMQFTDASNEVLSAPTMNKTAVGAMVAGITQTSQVTSFFDALSTGVDQLAAADADVKMLVILSDFEDTDSSYLDDDNPIALLNDFKTAGGIVLCFGIRAHDAGYSLGQALATGGFFINSYNGTEDAALDYLSGLKGYVCAGNCTPTGDEFKATGSLNYCEFEKWNVIDGHVDLIGNGFMDLLPGNGLYVDLAGSRDPYRGMMVTKDAISIAAGVSYRLSVMLSGNQRVNATPNSVRLRVFSRNNDGLENPSNAPTINLFVGGDPIPDEIHEYAFSYVNANGETELSDSDSGTIQFDASTVSLSAPANPLADLVRFYRKYNGRFYLIAEANAAAPMYDDTVLDADLAAAIANGTVDTCSQPPDANTTGTPIDLLNQVLSLNNFQQQLQTFSYTFVAPGDADVFISIQQVSTPSGYDSIGLLLDSVKFTNATDLITLFEDDFDGENMQYVPPACGVGTNYVLLDDDTYGYASGYSCYGTPCLTEPPAAQAEDPNPLPDIESGFTPPQTFSSTKTVCVGCPAGSTNASPSGLIPVMTSNTAPSGQVFTNAADPYDDNAFQAFDDDVNTTWIPGPSVTATIVGYKFAIATIVNSYSIQPNQAPVAIGAPMSWMFQGSNDGTTWTTLDTKTGVHAWTAAPSLFAFSNSTAYLYYRLNITETISAPTANMNIVGIQFYRTTATQICASASATSEVSQGDADSQAIAAATATAQAQLNCVPFWTATESFTATCPVGTFGLSITRSATVTSFVSQEDADQRAAAAAQEAAEALLDCTQSNNGQQITIIDRANGSPGPAASTPYPSVKFVEGLTGVITKVTLAITGFSHTFPDDVHVLLRSPSGTLVGIFRNCGGNNPVTDLDFVFDDAAGGQLPDSTVLASGTFQTSNRDVEVPFPSPLPAGPYATLLSAFNGEDPNGAWSLWICDDLQGGAGTVDSWNLTITSA